MAVPGKKGIKQFSSSTILKESDTVLKVYCQPCDLDGHRLPAHGYCTNCSEHLCKTCFTLHRRHKLSRDHTLLDKTSMPKTMLTPITKQTENFTKPCPKHKMEMIKFYCDDHQDLLCSVCVTLEHQAISCHVKFIPDVSGKIIDSKEYKDILKEINDMSERSSQTLQDMKEMIKKSNKSLTDALSIIKKFRTEINQRIDELERKVEDAARVIQNDNSNNLIKVQKVCEDVSKLLQSSTDAIKHSNTSKNANDLFMELKKAEQMIKDNEKKVANVSNVKVKEYNFYHNEAIYIHLVKEKSLGTLIGTPLSPCLKPRQCSLIDKICIKASQDKKLMSCFITGMTLLNSNLLLIADVYNSSVKMVDISRKSVIAQLCLDQEPCDVTSVSQSDLAVTLPHKKNIQFISVSRKNIKKKHNLNVDAKCWYISCYEGKMVVSFENPSKVQILYTNGTLLQSIQDENIFKCPEYITTCDNSIYVSDPIMKTVTKISWQGELKGKYVCTDKPRGLTMSDNGTVLVCYSDNSTIGEISGDCTKGQVVVKDIKRPLAVCWSPENFTLYTSIWTSFEGDYINFLQLSK